MREPLISVVVPVYDGEATIGPCIDSLLALDYPAERLEVIAVDNGSRDGTDAILRRYPVIRLTELRRGAAAARNAGIQRARGEIIAFTDADCVVGESWAREIAASLEDPAVDAVLGFSHGINANRFAELAQRRWEAFWLKEGPEGYTPRRKGVDTRNCALRKRVLELHGAFDAQLTECEDLELSLRLNRAGCRIAFNERMKTWHRNPTSLVLSLDKARRRMETVVKLMRERPEAFEEPDCPLPKSAFFGVAENDLGHRARGAVISLMAVLRWTVFACFKGSFTLGLPQSIVLKFYKVHYGICYDLAILRAKGALADPARRGPR